MLLVPDVDGIAAQQVQQLGEYVSRPAADDGRRDGRRTQEALALQAGEYRRRRGEEDGKAEREEVGRVSRAGEDVSRDLEVAVSDLYKDLALEQLGYQPGHYDASIISTARIYTSCKAKSKGPYGCRTVHRRRA